MSSLFFCEGFSFVHVIITTTISWQPGFATGDSTGVFASVLFVYYTDVFKIIQPP